MRLTFLHSVKSPTHLQEQNMERIHILNAAIRGPYFRDVCRDDGDDDPSLQLCNVQKIYHCAPVSASTDQRHVTRSLIQQ